MRLPMTLVATLPTRSTTNAVKRIPSPGMSRCNQTAKNGRTNPSMTLKIQINAVTLITSGTVTKNPVMKLRRRVLNKPDRQRRERNAVVREHVEAVPCEESQEVL